jgi:hypothetical protein
MVQESCETVTTEFVSWPPPCTGGNEACGVSPRSSIVETVGSIREEPKKEHHLSVEKAHSSLQSYSTEVLGPRVRRLDQIYKRSCMKTICPTVISSLEPVGSMLRRRRSSRKKRLLAEAACVRWPKVPLHEASVLQTDLRIE